MPIRPRSPSWRTISYGNDFVRSSSAATGAVIGGVLLLKLPSSVFDAVVPVLILLACGLMLLRPAPAPAHGGPRRNRLALGVFAAALTGVYGGYFGAAQGIILLAVLRL